MKGNLVSPKALAISCTLSIFSQVSFSHELSQPFLDFLQNINSQNCLQQLSDYKKQIENKLINSKKFIEMFEHDYLNEYYDDLGKPNLSDENFDSLIIEKTLKKFNQ